MSDKKQTPAANRQPPTANRPPTLDHIGIAVTSLDEVRIYEALGLNVDHVELVESQGVKTAFVPVGDANVELLEPTRPDSPVGRFIEKRGPGIHHICFRVANLDSELARLKALGFRLVHETPVPGSRGCRVAFLHPSAGDGVLIELSERVGSHD
jgi:methylmalonyl-CoA epimerase